MRKIVKWITIMLLLLCNSANKPNHEDRSIAAKKRVLLSGNSSEDVGNITYEFANCASPNFNYGRYTRFFNEKSSSMKQFFRDIYEKDEISLTETQEKNKKQKGKSQGLTKVYTYHQEPASKRTVEAHYFDENNLIVGYLRIKREYLVQDRSYYLNCSGKDSYLSKIKASIRKMTSLPLTRIPLPRSGETLELYALNHDGYTEQYGFILHEGHLYWVLDGFYPDDFEKEYTRKALKSIDNFIVDKHWSFPEPEDYKVD
jgi:hypothetical protein